MNFYSLFSLKFLLFKNKSFIWKSENQGIKVRSNIKTINIDLLVGIDRQKKTLLNNTLNFAKGNFTNNNPERIKM